MVAYKSYKHEDLNLIPRTYIKSQVWWDADIDKFQGLAIQSA